jgi:uncharacterized membrane protein
MVPAQFPPCNYEMVFPTEGQSPRFSASALNDDGVVLLSRLDSSNNPEAALTWEEAAGLVEVAVPPGTTRSAAKAINDAGTIAADLTASGVSNAGILRDGTWIMIPGAGPGGYSSVAALNAHGAAVGTRGLLPTTDYDDQAFIWSDGEITLIQQPGAIRTQVFDINDFDVVIGRHQVGPDYQPFAWSRGVFSPLPTPADAVLATPRAINNNGQIVGQIRAGGISGRDVPVIWDNGRITMLPLPANAHFGSALDIADNGDVVGVVYDDFDVGGWYQPSRAALWRDGVFVDLDASISSQLPNWVTGANAINDHGEVLAFAGYPVLLKPTPFSSADVNSDCAVNQIDLLIVISEWGKTNSPADANDDGVVNVTDLLMVIAAWN